MAIGKKIRNRSMRIEARREAKWLHTLFKKAYELSVLTDSKVAIVLKTSSGHLHEFVTPGNSMEHILKSYQKDIGITPPEAQGNGNGNDNDMSPKEDSDIPPLEDNTPDETLQQDPFLPFQHLKLSKSDMHMILDSYTTGQIEQFEQQLKQAMIMLLQRKVEIIKDKVQDKGKKPLTGATDSEEIRFELGSTSRIMDVGSSSSEARDGEEIPFEVGSTSRIMETVYPSRARDREEIRFDVGSTSRIMEVVSSSSGPQESEDMELDLALSLRSSWWK